MKILKLQDIPPEENKAFSLRTVFEKENKDTTVKIGTVTIYPGERVPLTGVSNHTEDEYSVIVKGTLLTESNGNQHRVSSGQATFIPAGEEHIAFNDGEETCELVFVLVG
ncbi:cupin domain-containing protein [Fictibacillus terranigra]|uniref:Cupin domain-containing protein n=1 Tax=Fictibacillus terranigra TaxID=3058424 RepID=A0ABT8EC38_9BACL|nr:cupin domain-containing protein [Fictibacillus sp. CENA-BCM004]MDN4075456.1 cupin domain-containing protein [Fictibacillus sp. CENA-BCM004]